MYKLYHVKDIEGITEIPKAVFDVAYNILSNLDKYYGVERIGEEEDGGYVVIFVDSDDYNSFTDFEDLGISLMESIPEYVEVIYTDTEDFANVLILANNEYSCSIILPVKELPENLKNELYEGD